MPATDVEIYIFVRDCFCIISCELSISLIENLALEYIAMIYPWSLLDGLSLCLEPHLNTNLNGSELSDSSWKRLFQPDFVADAELTAALALYNMNILFLKSQRTANKIPLPILEAVDEAIPTAQVVKLWSAPRITSWHQNKQASTAIEVTDL